MLRRIRFIDPPVMTDGELEVVEQTEELLPELLELLVLPELPVLLLLTLELPAELLFLS